MCNACERRNVVDEHFLTLTNPKSIEVQQILRVCKDGYGNKLDGQRKIRLLGGTHGHLCLQEMRHRQQDIRKGGRDGGQSRMESDI